MQSGTTPTFADIAEARQRLRDIARVTPVYRSETFTRLTGRPVHLKAENLQRTGSFKIRGAVNRVATLGEAERGAGVVTASAGNHGQAVAWAAREAGISATIFMPQDAPMAKVDATRSYGAAVELAGEGFDEAVAACREHVERTGATFVHAFEDPLIIAGQGTLGLELAEQLPELGTVVIPVGGGGLASGIAIALRELRPRVRLVGVQAAACAPLAGGTVHGFTIADGIAVKQPGTITSAILAELLDEVVAVSDEHISRAIVLLSGGNIDPTLLMQVTRHGLTAAGRYLILRTCVPDRPGELLALLQLVAGERVNVVSVSHRREGVLIGLGETEIELTLSTRDEAHCEGLLAAMRGRGYAVERLS